MNCFRKRKKTVSCVIKKWTREILCSVTYIVNCLRDLNQFLFLNGATLVAALGGKLKRGKGIGGG